MDSSLWYRLFSQDRYKGAVEGLLGNFNGDPSDDLVPRSVNTPLSVDSTSEDLHYNFGLTCKEDIISFHFIVHLYRDNSQRE